MKNDIYVCARCEAVLMTSAMKTSDSEKANARIGDHLHRRRSFNGDNLSCEFNLKRKRQGQKTKPPVIRNYLRSCARNFAG